MDLQFLLSIEDFLWAQLALEIPLKLVLLLELVQIRPAKISLNFFMTWNVSVLI